MMKLCFKTLLVEEYMCQLSYREGLNTYYNAVLLQVTIYCHSNPDKAQTKTTDQQSTHFKLICL